MKIKIPQVIRQIRLEEHAPEYGEAVIHVWVNPTEDELRRFEGIRSEMIELGDKIGKAQGEQVKELAEKISETNHKLNEWYALIWSKDADPDTHWTAEEVHQLANAAIEGDPRLWEFVQTRTFELIREYRQDGYRKKSETTSSI